MLDFGLYAGSYAYAAQAAVLLLRVTGIIPVAILVAAVAAIPVAVEALAVVVPADSSIGKVEVSALMEKILYVNACVRKESRTNQLAQCVLGQMDGEITEVYLEDEDIKPLNRDLLDERNQLVEERDFLDSSFKYARAFADADIIVAAAPYWDLLFPAILKIYLERINVAGITFKYEDNGHIKSLCAAKKLIYVTTAGGPIIEPNMGYAYLKQVCESFFGISDFEYFKAEGLDIIGADVDAILCKAEEEIKERLR